MLQLYHGQTKLFFNEMKMRSALYIDQHTSSLKQQSTDRHVAPMGHIILIPSQPVFSLSPFSAAFLMEKQQIPIL